MTTNFTGHDAAISPTDAEGVMFAATPAWERRRKTSRFGARKVAPEPRSFAPDTRPSMAPISGSRAVRSGGGVSPIAIALAVGAVTVLGGASWLALRNQEPVVEMTPASTTSEIAAAPITSTPDPVTVAENTPAETTRVTRVAPAEPRRAAPTARVRPAATALAAASASDTGVNVSATIPDGPQPYSTLNPSAAPQPVSPAAPAITEAAPPVQDSIPVTPPTAPEPAPASETPATDPPT